LKIYTCNYQIEVSNVICNQVGSQTVYQIVININNPSSQTAWATFTSPTGQGYFSPSTLVLPPWNSTQTLTFTGQVGFNGGNLTIHVSAVVGDKVCQQEFDVDLPSDCIPVEECQFGYKLGDVSCIRTGSGLIYHISIEITNPYAVSATTVLSVPTSMGTISPVSVTSPNGITMQHFYFYPNNGYFSLPVTVTNTIGTVNCIKEFEIRLPEYCPPARRCNFTYQVNSIVCQQQTNGSFGYSISMAVTNPYSVPATITLTATNGEGVFVPATLSLPINPTITVQSFVFYPSAWFLGGNVEVMIEGHYKDEICISYLRMRFNEPCCLTCRIKTPVDLNASSDNLLVIAPNPAGAQSTIFYTFVKPTGTKRILLTDVLGRVLQEWTINDDLKGALEVDTSRYAQGSYLIMMQQEGEALKQIKMVKQ